MHEEAIKKIKNLTKSNDILPMIPITNTLE